MKKAKLLLLLFLGAIASIQAQTQTQTIDISTGTSPIGTQDPNWMYSSGSIFQPAWVAAPMPNYANPGCAQWIAPGLDPTTQQPGGFPIANWTYKREIEVDLENCNATIANIVLDFVGADDQLMDLYFNGTWLPFGNGTTISFNPGGSINRNVTHLVVDGTNTISLVVRNLVAPSPTALAVCGNLIVTKECCTTAVPENLNAFNNSVFNPFPWIPTLNDYTVSWDPVPTAIQYQVEVIFGDLTCCPGYTGGQYASSFTSTTPSVTFTTGEDCFSYRVRAQCPDGSYGPWSAYECSSSDGLVISFREKAEEQAEELPEVKTFPNPGPGAFTVEIPNAESVTYQVTNLNGQVVVNQRVENTNTVQVNLTAHPDGIYLLHVVGNDRTEVIKLVKRQ